MNRKSQAGVTLAETMFAVAILGVMIFATITTTSTALNSTKLNSDKQFATEKAISILEELRGLVQVQNGETITVLDSYDDGVVNKQILTTNSKITDAAAPLSGNTNLGNKWLYERRISVQHMPGQANNIRLVNVKIFKNDPTGQRLVAEIASVIRTLVTTLPPSQVFDVYTVAVENVPGWWVYMSNIVPFVSSAINDLQTRNPGLVFRVHRITALSYGRDPYYRPYLNDTLDSTNDINHVYFYPALMPSSAANNYYYYTGFFKAHINVDGVDTHGADSTISPPNNNPYALADQYNHAMRYYDEKRKYSARVADSQLELASDGTLVTNTNATPEEPSWRYLLDDMYMHPSKYTNTILINLHGELLPFPPIRNYSDAAKDPETYPTARVVTHPENLAYGNSDLVRLRVYSYLTDPSGALSVLPSTVPITIRVCCTKNWTPTTAGTVVRIAGSDTVAYSTTNAPSSVSAGNMYFDATTALADNSVKDDNGSTPLYETTFRLWNSPLKCGYNTTQKRGLHPSAELYGMEYIPSPQEDLTTIAPNTAWVQTLDSADVNANSPRPKNTARWVISLPASIFYNDQHYTVRTYLGDGSSNLKYAPIDVPLDLKPASLSTTYFWRGTDTWLYGDTNYTSATNEAHLPITERFQFLGDPRHCPYADLKRPHQTGTFPAGPTPPAGSYESPLGMGYNRVFDDMEDLSGDAMHSAYIVSSLPEPYNVKSTNNKMAFKFQSTTAVTVTLTNGTTRSAQDIVNDLQANSTFTASAGAKAIAGYVVVTSRDRTTNSSVLFDKTVTNNSQTLMGYDGPTIHKIGSTGAAMWNGWIYKVGTPQYGLKNDGDDNNDNWSASGSQMDIDVPRAFQIVRNAIIRTNAIYTTMTGWSYYYMGIGNEIGYDSANSFDNSIPVSSKPFTGVSGSQYEDSILGPVKYIKENLDTDYWWSINWLGELYPDSRWSTWTGSTTASASGNLPTGTGSDKYVRTSRAEIDSPGSALGGPSATAHHTAWFTLPAGTTYQPTIKRTNAQGSTTLFSTGTAGSTFHHSGQSGTFATIQTEGTEIATSYQFPIPTSISNDRPFSLTSGTTSYNPDFFLESTYGGTYTSAVLDQYYQHDSDSIQGSSLVWLKDSNNNPAFIVVNGLSPAGISGAAFIARWSFLTLVHTYFEAGLFNDGTASPKRVKQLPQLQITSPDVFSNLDKPTSISVKWAIAWKRWDGKPYTPSYTSTFTESGITMNYATLYSKDNGVTWLYMQTDTKATIGVAPTGSNIVTSTTYNWDTSNTTKLPEGTYLIRVEGYRVGYAQHYSYHQFRGYINRK